MNYQFNKLHLKEILTVGIVGFSQPTRSLTEFCRELHHWNQEVDVRRVHIPWGHKLCTHLRGAAKATGAIFMESIAANERRIVDRKVIVVIKSISRSTMKLDEVTDVWVLRGE